jgi:predicted urease superfamily metal-dependent hydrolase
MGLDLTFHRLDFVVRAFQRAGGNGVVLVGQETVSVKAKRSGKWMKHAKVGGFRSANPIE